MEKQERSRIGLSFIVGIIGAYFLSKSLTNMGFYFGLDEFTSTTNTRYLMSILTGLIIGAVVILIPKTQKIRALIFVIGSLLLMDCVAYFSTEMPIGEMINRMLVTISLSFSGLITFFIHKSFKSSGKESIT